MSDSESSSSSGFFSDDEDAYRRDYQLEKEYQVDDLAKGGLKLDTVGFERKSEPEEKQPEVVRQTNQAFLHSSKFTGVSGMINDNVVRSLDESLKDILKKVDSGPEKSLPNERFSRLNRGKSPASDQISVADRILTNVQRTTAYAATQLKPIVLPRAGKVGTSVVSEDKHAPNVNHSPLIASPATSTATLPSFSNAQQKSSNTTAVTEAPHVPKDDHSDSNSVAIRTTEPRGTNNHHSFDTTDEADLLITELSKDPLGFEVERGESYPQPCQLNEMQFKTLVDTDPYSLSIEKDIHPLSDKMVRNNTLLMFCYNIELMPQAEDIALLWGKVLTTPEDGRKFNATNPYVNRAQSACIVVKGLRRIFYILPRDPIEICDTKNMTADEINTLFERIFVKAPDPTYTDEIDYICLDQPILPDDTQRNQVDLVNISVFLKLKADILEILQRYGIAPNTVTVRPVWRRYVFNERALPRYPRVWIEVTYPANKPPVSPILFGPQVLGVRKDISDVTTANLQSDIGVEAVVGHTISPLEYWLAKTRISGPMWLHVTQIDWEFYKARTQAISALIKQHPKLTLPQAISLYTDSRSCTLVYHEFHTNIQQSQSDSIIRPIYKFGTKKDQSTTPLPLLSVCTVQVRYIPEASRVQPSSKVGKTMAPVVKNVATTITVTYHPGYSVEGASFQTELLTQTHILARKLVHINMPSDSSHIVPLSKLSYDSLNKEPLSDSATISIRIKLVDKELQLYEELSKVLMHFNPDIIMGHNIYFHLYNAMWHSRSCLTTDSFKNTILAGLSRLNPRILRIESLFKTFQTARSSWHVMNTIHGRLLMDLERGISEFSTDTKLTTIDYTASSLLKRDLPITPASHLGSKLKVGAQFKTQVIPELIAEVLALIGIANALNYIPLTCRISQLTALPWQLVCSIGRARRAESLILYNFFVMPYILPDIEYKAHEQGAKSHDEVRSKDDTTADVTEEARYGAGYEGGYVMDPVAGFHDRIVIVLDFNSLYPNIIREYNLCFTTLDPQNYITGTDSTSTNDGSSSLVHLHADPQDAWNQTIEEEIRISKQISHTVILPKIIARLITQRQAIKGKIKDLEAMQVKDDKTLNQRLKMLDISQLAIKLCANAMYGSLGYQYGRFYCPHVAARIPARGRLELTRASNIAKQQGFQVIYGDTDSIMIKTNLEYDKSEKHKIMAQVKAIATTISSRVGEDRKYLQLGLDYIFIKYLLLQKKKYAATRLFPDFSVALEYKGLDLVRRDWCPISRTVSKRALEIIMGYPQNVVASNLLNMLVASHKDILAFRTPAYELTYAQQFKMTKSLTKQLHQYSATAATQLPHVFVAMEMQRIGKPVRIGDIIEYLVLSNKGVLALQVAMGKDGKQATFNDASDLKQASTSPSGDIARRSVPFEYYSQYLSGCPLVNVLDIEWYIKNQIIPPLQRVCSYVPDLSAGQLAECFGLDSRDYIADTVSEEQLTGFNRQEYSIEVRRRYGSCCCFIYHCACGGPKSVTAWPPPIKDYRSSEDTIVTPHPDLETPSNTFRKEKAIQSDEPLLSPLDFDVLRCGCRLTLGCFVSSLHKQLAQMLRLYEAQLSYCVHQTCPLYLTEEVRRKIYPGCYTSQLDAYNIQYKKYAIATLSGKDCGVPGCGGTLVPVFTSSMLRDQLLFFSLLFDLTSVLYTVPDKAVPFQSDPGDRLRTIFNAGAQLVNSYIEKNDYINIDLTDHIESIFAALANPQKIPIQ
ncbi:DNA polymerase alpha subunit A [Giardia lamblia P15]|uniref:DNA polymerase n=1 Tax=Giardia intestinalis (strain P15) TaxID=658858 RepID=E1F955_GIAIA|nr:DNA polymerase alpha subunit A [Giardia lamblia P15]